MYWNYVAECGRIYDHVTENIHRLYTLRLIHGAASWHDKARQFVESEIVSSTHFATLCY